MTYFNPNAVKASEVPTVRVTEADLISVIKEVPKDTHFKDLLEEMAIKNKEHDYNGMMTKMLQKNQAAAAPN